MQPSPRPSRLAFKFCAKSRCTGMYNIQHRRINRLTNIQPFIDIGNALLCLTVRLNRCLRNTYQEPDTFLFAASYPCLILPPYNSRKVLFKSKFFLLLLYATGILSRVWRRRYHVPKSRSIAAKPETGSKHIKALHIKKGYEFVKPGMICLLLFVPLPCAS